MKTAKIGSLFLVIGMMAACSQAPQAPTFMKKGGGDVSADGGSVGGGGDTTGGGTGPDTTDTLSVALFKEFDEFVKEADELDIKTLDNAGKLPALVVESQLTISDLYATNKKEEPAEAKGRCLLYASNDKVFTEKELGSGDLVLSPAGKIVYSKAATLGSDECQKLFKEKLAERYKTDFFNLHEVFYGGLK